MSAILLRDAASLQYCTTMTLALFASAMPIIYAARRAD